MSKENNKNMKMSKQKFEEVLVTKYKLKVLEYSPYRYSDYQDCDAWGTPKQKMMTLYYGNDGHIGSWKKGECWFID